MRNRPSRWLGLVLVLLVLLVLGLCGGCTGWLVDALNERHVKSCIWWHSMFGTARGVSATGGISIDTCLKVPSQLP